jgi:putative FmdB family regulatory protein
VKTKIQTRETNSHVRGDVVMPLYEYYCETCKREVTVPMSVSEHDKGSVTCPQCHGRDIRPLLGTFFSKTSRKS